MDNRERALLIIRDYILDLGFKEGSQFNDSGCRVRRIPIKRKYFDQKSYSNWAANEVLLYVQKHSDMSPIEAIEEFAKKVDRYSVKNPNTSYIFSVAYDVAMDILDVFIAMQ